MNGIYNWGIEIIEWCQKASPYLDIPFKLFSFSGDIIFYILFFPLLIWCISYRTGIRITIFFLFNAYVNSLIKLILAQPRPSGFDSDVNALVKADGYGLPSGHTQNPLVVWGYLMKHFDRKWLRVLAVIMIICVPFSRIYLGVHFPTDVLGGYLIGALILFLILRFEDPIIGWIKEQNLLMQLGISITIPLIMVFILPEYESSGLIACATLFGGGIGICIERKYLGYEVPDDLWKKVVCYILGIAIMLLLYIGLKLLFKNLEPAPIFRFFRYAIIGFYDVFLAPLLFFKINLGRNERKLSGE